MISSQQNKRSAILVAEDDPDDRILTADAFRETRFTNQLLFVEDGEQLIRYLRRESIFADQDKFPQPGLVLLDLNMPRKDGREALKEIKSDPELKRIPVVVFTTSRAVEDIAQAYELGVNCFIVKPDTFGGLVEVIRHLGKYWFEIAKLPA